MDQTLEDVQAMCRLCMKQQLGMHDIHVIDSIHDDKPLSHLINWITQLPINPDDGLPPGACSQCILQLHGAIQFVDQCLTVDQQLRDLIAQITGTGENDSQEQKLEDDKYTAMEEIHSEEIVQDATMSEISSQDNYLQEINEGMEVVGPGVSYLDEINEVVVSEASGPQRSRVVTLSKGTRNETESAVSHLIKAEGSGVRVSVRPANDFDEQGHFVSLGDVEGLRLETLPHNVNPNTPVVKNRKRSYPKSKNVTLKPQQCNICSVTFEKKQLLAAHMDLHKEPDKPAHQCPSCLHLYPTLKELEKHLVVLTGGKPFTCELCGMFFSRQDSLNKHVRIHTNERAFQCDTCPKSFVHAWSLVTHKRTHTGERPHRCDECGRGFGDKKGLKRHKPKCTGLKEVKEEPEDVVEVFEID